MKLAGRSAVTEYDAIPSPAIHLKNAPGGHGADECVVYRWCVIGVMNAVEGAQYVGKRKGSDQSLLNPVALDGGDGRVRRLNLGAVEELKAANLQLVGLGSEQAMKTNENLFGKYHRRIGLLVIGDIIAGAETQLTLVSGGDGIGGQIEQDRRLQLKHPVEWLKILTESQSNRIAVERVIVLAGGGREPVPVLDAIANAAEESYRPELNRFKSLLRLNRRNDGKKGNKGGPIKLKRHCSIMTYVRSTVHSMFALDDRSYEPARNTLVFRHSPGSIDSRGRNFRA